MHLLVFLHSYKGFDKVDKGTSRVTPDPINIVGNKSYMHFESQPVTIQSKILIPKLHIEVTTLIIKI